MNCCILLSSVSSIDNIRNENLIIDYGWYEGVVHGFENKLIVSCQNKIEEYEILPSGDLTKISIYEKRNSFYGFFDENRYYDVDTITFDDQVKITVFDLSTTPMEVITTIDVDVDYSFWIDVGFTSHHLVISDGPNSRLTLINKNSYEIV